MLTSLYVFIKTLDWTVQKYLKLISIAWCFVFALLFVTRSSWLPFILAWLIFCTASVVFLLMLTKLKPDTVISAFLLSFGISYVLYYIASITVSAVFTPFIGGNHDPGTILNYNNPIHFIIYVLTSILQLAFSFLLFRIRRFKKGFPFILEDNAIIVALISAGTILSLVTWIKITTASVDAFSTAFLLVGVLIIGVGVLIWVRRGIRKTYRRRQEVHGIETLEQELAKQKAENQRLIEQNDALRVANHKVQHRLAALERAVLYLSGGNMEAGEDLAVTLEDIRRATQSYQNDIAQIKGSATLPTTKIKMLDELFAGFAAQFADNKIDFKLNVNGSIPYMVENVIEQGKLETMIGDHLQNALIAIKASECTFRSVWAIIGLSEDCYEFSVFDSGIPFEVDTLVHLGVEHMTTHADDGGSGIGFMTTFESIRVCNASLVICEKKPSATDYTKSIAIRFDCKRQYIIETYRPREFPVSDRFIVVKGNG